MTIRTANFLVLSLLCMSVAGAAVAEESTRADVLTAHAPGLAGKPEAARD